VKELLTLLHRDAAKNIIFCFTNSQLTALGPGLTLRLLKRSKNEHLEEQNEEIVVNCHTTYQFDSASFQFLAAAYQSVDVTNTETVEYYECIWKRSEREVNRLMDYLTSPSVLPHHVENTTDPNDTKELVRRMTVPLIRIVQAIESGVDRLTRQKADLEHR
jgi:hypothetical protein